VANPQNIEKYKWKKGQTLNPNGRPRKLVSGIIKELESQGVERVSPSQINDIISIFLNLSRTEIAGLANDNEQPIYIRVIARKLTATSDDKLFETLEKLLDRGHGKPTQRTELTGKDGEEFKINIITEDKTANEIINKI